ncbi:NAD-dependent epimerase/dehydratase family protein [Mameliella sediminis]|uniref:NAD-dependent epimerase/dehydratase family protein n=1 Tax=Mameliella sediminis TaxID=2836866 RepID=UPI001C46B753|nr:NAD(P)-dependent oxidoreductase [Mameliella sediminis]
MAGTQHARKVLLLGASGKLGRMVSKLWQSDLYTLVPVTRDLPIFDNGLQWAPGDPPPDIEGIASVVALWGVTPGPGRTLSDNTRLALAAMELAESLGAGSVLHCSSAAVYRPADGPIPETEQPDPQSAYGQAKLDMEQAIASREPKGKLRNVIMRIGNVAGADSLFANLTPGQKITLDQFADGQGPQRSYIAPQDLVRVIEALIRVGAEGTFNVAAPAPTPMADIVHAAGGQLAWRRAPKGAVPLVWLSTAALDPVIKLTCDIHSADHLVNAARQGGTWP